MIIAQSSLFDRYENVLLGDKRATAELPALKNKMILAQMNITEFDAQLKMLNVQCSQNQARRKEEVHTASYLRAPITCI
jgi:hypothetical protein